MSVTVNGTNGLTFPDGTIQTTAPSGFGYKNYIIGGDFGTNPWQRGTSFPAFAGGYIADRWGIGYTTTGVTTITNATDSPTASQAGTYTSSSLSIDVTTADTSIAAGDYYFLYQLIEGYNIASAGFGQSGTRYITLSFWVKSTKTGTFCVSFSNSANDRSYVSEYTVINSDVWEKKSITIPVDTTGTWLYTNGIGLRVRFAVMAGSTFQTTAGSWQTGNYNATSNQVNALDSTSNFFKLALVQLEFGATATNFDVRSVGTELALCQRYYYKTIGTAQSDPFGSGYVGSTSVIVVTVPLPVPMRTAPTALEQNGTANDYRVASAAFAGVCTGVPTHSNATVNNARVNFTTGASLTSGQGAMALANSATSYLAWSAEL